MSESLFNKAAGLFRTPFLRKHLWWLLLTIKLAEPQKQHARALNKKIKGSLQIAHILPSRQLRVQS